MATACTCAIIATSASASAVSRRVLQRCMTTTYRVSGWLFCGQSAMSTEAHGACIESAANATKYHDKLRMHATAAGFNCVEEFLANRREHMAHSSTPSSKETAVSRSQPQPQPQPQPPPYVKSLESILVDVDRLRGETKERVCDIWTSYHRDQSVATAKVLSAELYTRFHQRTKETKQIVLPLFSQDDGAMRNAEIFLVEHAGHSSMATRLSEYQLLGTNARVLMTVAHYTHLADTHNIVLVRTDAHPQELTKGQAEQLTHVLHQLYLGDDSYSLVSRMTTHPGDFCLENIIDASRRIMHCK